MFPGGPASRPWDYTYCTGCSSHSHTQNGCPTEANKLAEQMRQRDQRIFSHDPIILPIPMGTRLLFEKEGLPGCPICGRKGVCGCLR
jgi:hypothetical protein